MVQHPKSLECSGCEDDKRRLLRDNERSGRAAEILSHENRSRATVLKGRGRLRRSSVTRVRRRRSRSVEARGLANLRSIGKPVMVISSVFLQKGGCRWPLLSRLSGNPSSFFTGGGGSSFLFFLFLFAGLALDYGAVQPFASFCECLGEKSIKALGQGANRMSR